MPGESGFDMSGAVAEVADGLGFDLNSDLGEGHDGISDGNVEGTSGSVGTGTGPSPGANGDLGGAADAQTASTSTPAAAAAVLSEEHKHLFNEAGQLRTWRAEAAAEFSKLPPIVQSEILKRETDIFKGIEQYKESAAFGNSIRQVLSPYMPVLEKYGIKPDAQVADMMQAHYTLAFGSPEQKLGLLQKVASDYGIDIRNLQPPGGTEYVDPQVKDLQTQLQQLQSQMMQSQRAQETAKVAEIKRYVTAFASDPKNVYFEELAPDMANLLRTGAEKTVEAAYEKAMWMNPAVRAKELSRQQAEKAETERKAAAEKAEAARKATAANVTTSAKRGSAATPLGSMDDTLSTTLAAIRGRQG